MVTCFTLERPERISECLKDYAQRNGLSETRLASKIGINRMALRRICAGQFCPPSELKLIADGLDTYVERITQEDVKKLVAELDKIVSSGTLPKRALLLAEEFVEKAVGLTERTQSRWYLGRAYDINGDLSAAKNEFELAYDLALQTGKPALIKLTCNALMVCLSKMNDFDSLRDHLNKAIEDEMFGGDSEQMGRLHHYYGLCSAQEGDNEAAKKHYQTSLEMYQKAGKEKLAGRARLNLARRVMVDSDHHSAIALLKEALEALVEDEASVRLIALKELAKCYICIGEDKKALTIVQEGLMMITDKELNFRDLEVKFRLMQADLTNSAEPLKDVSVRNLNPSLRSQVCRFLVDYYLDAGNAAQAKVYFRLLMNTNEVSYERCEEF